MAGIRDRGTAVGGAIGVLMLDEAPVRVPGDPGVAESFDFPVIHQTVPGATLARVMAADPALTEAVVATARGLEARGVAAISSCCGHFIHYQEAVAEAVAVPAAVSSLTQVPRLLGWLGRERKLLIVAGSADREASVRSSLSEAVAARVILRGLYPRGGVASVAAADGTVDGARLRADTVALARAARREEPGIGAVLLEVSYLAPCAPAVRAVLGVPVLDTASLIAELHRVTAAAG